MMLAPIVTQYLKKGRVCVPLKDNSKEPFTKDHLNKTFSVEEFKTNSFGTNLEKSNECFVDCDSEYASRLVASFFPITETTKVGTRITHYTYKGRYTATALKFPDKTTIAELRNVGLQVKAPSFAPAKLYGNKVMQRETNGFDPVEAPADMIERWNKFCFASLCLRYIDSNNLPFVKLTQCLKHYTDWNDSAITEYVKVIADACVPKHAFDWKDIRHKVSSALKAYDNKNEKAFGYKSLSEEFGVDVNYMRKAIGWIGEVKPDNARKTVVNFKAEALTEEKMNSEVKMEYLIGQILPKAGLVILAGPPKSGKSNLITQLNKMSISIKNEEVNDILEIIKQKESEGFSYDTALASFEILVRRHIGQIKEYFNLNKFRVTDERRWNAKGKLVTDSEATVQLDVKNEEKMTVGVGNGPVNAIDSALRQALIDFYPTLKDLTLTDYKVMILSSEKGTGAITRVHIESTDDSKQHWTTVGVSSNIIDASYNAIYDSITYKLFNDLN